MKTGPVGVRHASARCQLGKGLNRYGLGVPDQRTARAGQSSAFTGVPWWGAVLIALSTTLVGIGIEAGSGHQELGGIFAGCYALGCVAAVLAVRRAGLFTAVIQPPLLLFVAVPLAYYLFHGSAFGGLKDILITCGYPLIERFPLMLFASSAVLLIGLARWYLAMSAPGRPQAPAAGRAQGAGLLAGVSARLASAFAGNGSGNDDAGARPARPRHVADRSATRRPAGSRPRPQDRAAAGARRSRPPADQFAQSARFAEAPPRRPRSGSGDHERGPEPRRRPRQSTDQRRTPPPTRRDRPDYRNRDWDSPPRQQRGNRVPAYDYEPRRRPAPGTDHHPVSRVRYRDSAPSGADLDGPPRSRPRR